jgi:hypothetical protein
MTIEKLREIHAARPFRPFTLDMADGAKLHVSHPESLAYSPSGRTIALVEPNDRHHYIDLIFGGSH